MAATVRIETDPYIRDMFTKSVVTARQERTDSDCRTVATYGYDAEAINTWEFVQVFKELSATERELLRIVWVPESKETSHERGFGKRYFETSYRMTPMDPLDGHRMYKFEYTNCVTDRDEMGMTDQSVSTVYTIENIIGLGSPKAPEFYGVTRAFVDWIRDRSVEREERTRRAEFARRIMGV